MQKVIDEQLWRNEMGFVFNAMSGSDELLNSTLKKCGLSIDEDADKWFLMKNMLQEHSGHRIISAIWGAINNKHLDHFNSFLDSARRVNPDASGRAVLIDFALMYEDILSNGFQALENFLNDFVEKYRLVF